MFGLCRLGCRLCCDQSCSWLSLRSGHYPDYRGIVFAGCFEISLFSRPSPDCAPEPEYIVSSVYPSSSYVPPGLPSSTLLDVYSSSSKSYSPSLYILSISLLCHPRVLLHLQVGSCHCIVCYSIYQAGLGFKAAACSCYSIVSRFSISNTNSSITSSPSTLILILTFGTSIIFLLDNSSSTSLHHYPVFRAL